MNKFKLLGIFLASFALTFVISAGCGHYKHRKVYANIAVVDSSTMSGAGNVTIIVEQPAAPDNSALLNEILTELQRIGDLDVNVTVIVENDIDIDGYVEVDGDRIIVCPGKQRTVPNLYHCWHKVTGKRCKSDECKKHPKPCDNEDDDHKENDD